MSDEDPRVEILREAQAAEDEGRVVPELAAARRVLDEERRAESGVPDFGAVLRAAREKRKSV